MSSPVGSARSLLHWSSPYLGGDEAAATRSDAQWPWPQSPSDGLLAPTPAAESAFQSATPPQGLSSWLPDIGSIGRFPTSRPTGSGEVTDLDAAPLTPSPGLSESARPPPWI